MLFTSDGERSNPDGHTYQYNPGINNMVLRDMSTKGIARTDVRIPIYGTM